mgnify:CR=1 FL=1
MEFLSLLINGISLGSMYALIALGYTMVYGIAKMLNFAHGDVIMIGGIATYEIMSNVTANPAVAVVVSVVVCTVLGITIEKVAYKPLRRASSLAVLITAIGVSYLLQNIALLTFGTANKSYTVKALDFSVGIVKGSAIVNITAALIIMIALSLFMKYSKQGKAMLAVSEDKDAAQLMGINVNSTISLTFAIGSALAGVAGFLYLGTYGQIGAYSGSMPGIKAFTAAVFGGIGSVPGAMIGGILLGIIEQTSRYYLNGVGVGNLTDAFAFVILIIILLIKPTGIMGKKIQEKV